MLLKLCYNTNGFSNHSLHSCLEVLAEIGYGGVAITLDHHALNPFSTDHAQEVSAVRAKIASLGLSASIETGARFLLDPRRKHQPSMLSADASARNRRIDFLRRAIDAAAELGAHPVSFWSGAKAPELSDDEAWRVLIDACGGLADYAQSRGVALAFEPEPGMFIERMADFARLNDALRHPSFGLTLDVGHVHCLSDGKPENRICEFAAALRNVHIEDMRAGKHEHLMFGDGEMGFPPIIAALKRVDYHGPLTVELSRHGHDAVNAARRAYEYLSGIIS